MSEQLSRRRRTLFTSAILLGVIGATALGVIWWRSASASDSRRAYDVGYPRRDQIIATVNATGQMQPAQVVNLNFSTPGRVAEVFVAAGASVEAGAALARLDSRELIIRQTQAAAQVQQAQANYAKLLAGARPTDLSAAEAQVRQAEAQVRQTNGSVTSADIQAAEAQVRQAEAQLQQLEAGPKATDARSSEAQVAQAEAQLKTQRDQLSAAKTNAQFQVDQAVNTLTQAQSRYATAQKNWQYVQDSGIDPIRPSLGSDLRGNDIPNRLNDAQRQQYADTFVQAEAALKGAEQALAQAQVGFDTARQNEVNGVQTAEQQLAQAQANRDRVQAGADSAQLASARAQLASARASLNKLRGDQRGGAVQVAQAALDQARANLARVAGNADSNDLTTARAQIESAQATLDLANLNLANATLTAPFAGTVAEVNLKVGELPSATKAPIVLTDLSSFYVDVAVDEIDVSRIKAGQPVTLTLDALPNLELAAEVARIAPLATSQSAVTAYQVRVAAKSNDSRVRPGMSTTADIVVAQEANVLLVPRRAVKNDRGRLIVETPTDAAICKLPREQRPQRPALRQIDVRTGLSNEQVIEITSGLEVGTCVYIEGVDAQFSIFSGRPGQRSN